MTAEIISIGTELLLGQIVDTNAGYLARTLGSLGINLYHKTTVGDNPGRVEAAIREAAGRADLIITSGGLGPTQDDLTKESIAAVFAEDLVMHEPSLQAMEAMFARRGIRMVDRNRKQALIYRTGCPIPNPNGTAPGALLEKSGKIVISLPGPPREMIPMVDDFVVPFLARKLGGDRIYLRSRVLRFIGIGESTLEERVDDLLASTNPTVAPLAHVGEVHLRITASAPSLDEAAALIEPMHREIANRTGHLLYGVDEVSLEAATLDALRATGQTLAVAESCTGGLLGGRLTSVPGSSEVFLGGIISYSNAAKERLLGVQSKTLQDWGAVSSQVAEEMAEGARRSLQADIGVSITGIAGPEGGSNEKPVGLIYIGLSDHQHTVSHRFELIGHRMDIRSRAVLLALDLVRMRVLRRHQ